MTDESDESKKAFLKVALNMQRIKEHSYDDPINGQKIRRLLESQGLGDVEKMIEEGVLCPANFLDANGNFVFRGVRICTRELVDLVDEIKQIAEVPESDLAIKMHLKAEKMKWEINERLFNEQYLSRH